MPHSTSRSLVPAFAPARDVSLAVKPASELALASPISIRIEPTFERLRYHLGGNRNTCQCSGQKTVETKLAPRSKIAGTTTLPSDRPAFQWCRSRRPAPGGRTVGGLRGERGDHRGRAPRRRGDAAAPCRTRGRLRPDESTTAEVKEEVGAGGAPEQARSKAICGARKINPTQPRNR